MSAISAAAMRCKTMADGSLRIEVEIEPADAQAAFALFGKPGAPMALAALAEGYAAVKEWPTLEPDKPKGGERSKWLAMRCKEPAFQAWIIKAFPLLAQNELPAEESEAYAKWMARRVIEIESRAEIDTNEVAKQRFDNLIRKPYMESQR
jgi:hypothetical protein